MIIRLFQTTLQTIIFIMFMYCLFSENPIFIPIFSLISGFLFEYIRSEIHLQEKNLKKANEKIKKLNWELSNWRLIYKKNNDKHLRKIINTIDDIKDKIPEGVYLQLMNYSKEIYENKENTCEGWWTESFELMSNNH